MVWSVSYSYDPFADISRVVEVRAIGSFRWNMTSNICVFRSLYARFLAKRAANPSFFAGS